MAFLRPIPPIAFIPMSVLYFGLGEMGKIVLIFFTAFNYAQYCAQNQTAEKYIQHPSTFLGKQKQTYLSFVYKPEYPALFEDSNQPFLSSDGKFIHHDPKMVNTVNKPKTTPLKTSFSAEQLLNIG